MEAQLMAEARTAREQRVAARARALVAAGVVEEGPAARAEAWRRVEEEEGAVARREGDPVLDDGRRIQVGGLGGGGLMTGVEWWGGFLSRRTHTSTHNQSINQPINQSTTQPINQSTNQSINQPINQSTTQPITHTTNQSINQSIN